MKTKRKSPRFPDAALGTEKSVSYGYVGRYRNGRLGWLCPEFLTGARDRPDHLSGQQCGAGRFHDETAFVLCRITVEVVPGARRRIVRRQKVTTP